MAHNPQTYRFFLMTIDPVHIGTGGARLGRVDNPIVREPGTNLPKIPGSSLHGVIRAYAAHRYGKPQCAGQGQQEGRKHCGRPTCPICYTFGYARDREGGYAGVVAISDARILLFPVYSMVGPVWVTSPSALKEAGIRAKNGQEIVLKNLNKARWSKELWKHGSSDDKATSQSINLGWLMVEKDDEKELPKIEWPPNIPDQIRNRVVLVSDKLFSQIVNSNLEVRTSVAIDPETGAAEEKALFTYEAIPRATILWMDVVVSDYRRQFPSQKRLEEWENLLQSSNNCPDNVQALLRQWKLWRGIEKCQEAIETAKGWLQDEKVEENGQTKWRWERQTMQGVEHKHDPLDIVQAGLEWAEHLGVGGMGTRGFGRIRELICVRVENHALKDSCQNDENAHGDTENTEKSSP